MVEKSKLPLCTYTNEYGLMHIIGGDFNGSAFHHKDIEQEAKS